MRQKSNLASVFETPWMGSWLVFRRYWVKLGPWFPFHSSCYSFKWFWVGILTPRGPPRGSIGSSDPPLSPPLVPSTFTPPYIRADSRHWVENCTWSGRVQKHRPWWFAVQRGRLIFQTLPGFNDWNCNLVRQNARQSIPLSLYLDRACHLSQTRSILIIHLPYLPHFPPTHELRYWEGKGKKIGKEPYKGKEGILN